MAKKPTTPKPWLPPAAARKLKETMTEAVRGGSVQREFTPEELKRAQKGGFVQ